MVSIVSVSVSVAVAMSSWAETDGAFVAAALAGWRKRKAAAAAEVAAEVASKRRRTAERDDKRAAKIWRRLMALEAKEDVATRWQEVEALKWYVRGEAARTSDNRRWLEAEDWLEEWWRWWRRSRAIVVDEVEVVAEEEEVEVVAEVVVVADAAEVEVVAQIIAVGD